MNAEPRPVAPGFAARLQDVPVAATVAMTMKARAMRAQGIEVIQLTIGEPDFASPADAVEAAYRAARQGDTKYPPLDGQPGLKQAIQRKFQRDSGLDYALDEIMVANGGKQAIFDALMATIDPGDEVIVPAPYWNAYPLMTRLVGGVPVPVACPENNGFRLLPEDLERAVTPCTKWLVLNYPNNPSGAAASAADLAALAEVMLRHPHVWILSDDMYEHLIYDAAHATIAAVEPRLRDRTVTVSGVSKTYAMTGWRVGYAAGPRRLIKAMVNVQGHATAGVATMAQAAAAAALDGPQDGVSERAGIYRRRRDLVLAALQDVPGLRCHRPEGAFYLFPNIAGCLGKTTPNGATLHIDEDFAMSLLQEQRVAVVHGAAFGMSPYVRISYAADEASLTDACARIGAFCRALS